MVSEANELLRELSTLGVYGDDDPIARAVMGQPEPSREETEDAPVRRWRGTALLRDGAVADVSAREEHVDDETERDVDALLAQAVVVTEATRGGDGAASDESSGVLDLLTEIRNLAQQQLRVLERMERAWVKGIPTLEARPVVSPGRSPQPDAQVVEESLVARADVAPVPVSKQEQVQQAQAERQNRLRERATQERERRAELMAQGLPPEEAMAQLEAEREEAVEASMDAQERLPSALDEVPMASEDPSGSPRRAEVSPSSRGESFDVDFDVSALSRRS